MRCTTRLVLVASLLAVALIVHVFISKHLGAGDRSKPLERQLHKADRSEGGHTAQTHVKTTESEKRGAAQPKIDRRPNTDDKLEQETIRTEDKQPVQADQSVSEEKVADELHVLYRKLRTDPAAVTKDLMLAQKLTFIRIAMCGSQSLINPMATVGKRNIPSLILTMVPDNITKSRGEAHPYTEKLIFEYLYRYPIPYLSVGGHRYVNFRKYGDFQPISFTVFADPVERFTKMFYLIRKLYIMNKRKGIQSADNLRLGPKARNTTLQRCATLLDKSRNDARQSRAIQRKYCGFELSSLALVMCGEDKRCSRHDATNYTLQEALRNLDDFLVVGFADDLDNTVRVMERLLPLYLRGYRQEFVDQFQTTEKKIHSLEVTNKLRRFLETDYVLYDEARKRFGKLKKEVNIG
ncbi:uronyl 2-sulfotransferase-like [Acanthaster planci]|uniref:Uronyl 2-sulfotransferase-like n=1 Tax=Acanthaster planci TaxID=133434 RepID=A0A8B7XTY2_ACAPL|nr:uronyl 2-sulfotransferase-like [Acanthaster planci]